MLRSSASLPVDMSVSLRPSRPTDGWLTNLLVILFQECQDAFVVLERNLLGFGELV